MPDDARTPDQIERDIERDRARLADTFDALQDRFSPEAVIREVAGGLTRHGGEIGTAVTRSVKQNPLGLALTGVGLAWLMFGRSHDDPAEPIRRRSPAADGYDREDFETGQSPHPAGGYAARDRYDGADTRRTGRPTGAYYPAWARLELDEDDAPRAADDGPSLGDRASDAASAAGEAARSARSAVAETAQEAADRASRAQARLARGTEDLGEAARARILAARQRALEVAEQTEAAARRNYARGRDATADFFEEQPLVAGALALAVGAALAGALPRTRREDEVMGETRDQLFDEAERIFREERDKAERVARAAADEAATIVEEKRDAADAAAPGRKSAAEAAADEVRDAGRRVADAARQKAEDEDLGHPKG
ncbi:MAG: DUF3618 domain-containing protein [Rhodobacteraceae bacterium]|nr:MAG: DUF3618 domain-containing protein [Paracoccaceae bacterium]